MTQEEKQLLLIALCSMLPYSVRARFCDGVKEETDDVWDIDMFSGAINADYIIDDVKPYLRPMSSMTDEERGISEQIYKDSGFWAHFDWLNANHFDYRGLIPIGLALEAPEDMYKTE